MHPSRDWCSAPSSGAEAIASPHAPAVRRRLVLLLFHLLPALLPPTPAAAVSAGNSSALIIAAGGSDVFGLHAGNGSQAWQVTGAADAYYLNPTVVDGTIYLCNQLTLQALSLTGQTLWNWTSVSGWRLSDAAPAVGGGIVYIGDVVSSFYALDARTGRLLWTKSFAPALVDCQAPAAVASSGHVVFGCTDDVLRCFMPNGTQLWAATLVATPSAGISFNAAEDTVYALAQTYVLYALNMSTGDILWQLAVQNQSASIGGGLAVNGKDGTLYCGTAPPLRGYLVAVSPGGQLLWQAELLPRPQGAPNCSPVVSPRDGTIFIGNLGYVYAYHPAGQLKWVYYDGDMTGYINSVTLGLNGTVAYYTGATVVYALDADSGKLLWNVTKDAFFASPAIASCSCPPPFFVSRCLVACAVP